MWTARSLLYDTTWTAFAPQWAVDSGLAFEHWGTRLIMVDDGDGSSACNRYRMTKGESESC